MDKNRSMVDVAYELMSKKKKAVNFYKLWQEVSEVKGFDEEEEKPHRRTKRKKKQGSKKSGKVVKIVVGAVVGVAAVVYLGFSTV